MSVGRRRRHLRPTMAVALGFLGAIAAGTALLAAPRSSADGTATPLSDALFTAMSATCLTGLITVDTATHWSTAGQVTIMALIQFGGLGFMTMASLMALLVGGRMGLRRRLGATAEGRGLDLGDVAWGGRATVLFTLFGFTATMYMLNKVIATLLVMVWNYFTKRAVLQSPFVAQLTKRWLRK